MRDLEYSPAELGGTMEHGRLPTPGSLVAVCAHPDDESFGLGALLDRFCSSGASVSVLCFTQGEASTLGEVPDLGEVRSRELAEAAAALGVHSVRLLRHPDGALDQVPTGALAEEVLETAHRVRADALMVFDEGGITGHRDHMAATEAAVTASASLGIPVLAWALDKHVAEALNESFPGGGFVGRSPGEIDIRVQVERGRQMLAIAQHRTQATDNPVLRRRLALQGSTEALRWLVRPGAPAAGQR